MKNYDEVYKDAVTQFGEEKQLDVAIEELSELITAIQHFRRSKAKRGAVLDEIADVTIMLGQLRYIFNINSEELKEIQSKKVILLLEKLSKGNTN